MHIYNPGVPGLLSVFLVVREACEPPNGISCLKRKQSDIYTSIECIDRGKAAARSRSWFTLWRRGKPKEEEARACQPNIPKQWGLNNRNCQILYFFYSEGVDPAGAKEVNDLLSTKSWLCRDPKFWGCGCACLLPMLPSVATSKSKFCSNNERRIGSWWQLWCKGLFALIFLYKGKIIHTYTLPWHLQLHPTHTHSPI